jgi:hypothetical protein
VNVESSDDERNESTQPSWPLMQTFMHLLPSFSEESAMKKTMERRKRLVKATERASTQDPMLSAPIQRPSTAHNQVLSIVGPIPNIPCSPNIAEESSESIRSPTSPSTAIGSLSMPLKRAFTPDIVKPTKRSHAPRTSKLCLLCLAEPWTPEDKKVLLPQRASCFVC